MLHHVTTGGTSPQAGNSYIFNLREGYNVTFLQVFKDWVFAAIILTLVRARARSFPLLQTLPAELIGLTSLCCTDGAVYAEIGQVRPLNKRLATRALERKKAEEYRVR